MVDSDVEEQKDIMDASPEKVKWNSFMLKMKGVKARGKLAK